MLKAYLRIAFRSLTRQKVYASINIVGAVTVSAALLAVFYEAAAVNPVESLRQDRDVVPNQLLDKSAYSD